MRKLPLNNAEHTRNPLEEVNPNEFHLLRSILRRRFGPNGEDNHSSPAVLKRADKMLRRIHAAEQTFENTIGNTAMEIADLANERDRGPWSRWKRDYNVTVREADDCRKLLKIRYNPSDRRELREILQSGVNAYREVFDEAVAGIHAIVEFADGTRERIRDLTAQINARTSATAVADEARRWENAETESVDWDAWAEQERQRATR